MLQQSRGMIEVSLISELVSNTSLVLMSPVYTTNGRLHEEITQLKQGNTQLKKAEKHYKSYCGCQTYEMKRFDDKLDEHKKRLVLSCAA